MIKEAVIHGFWSSFGLPAFDENSVPTESEFEKMGIKPFPRITYDVVTGNLGDECAMSASLWYKGDGADGSWENITKKLREVEQKLTRGGRCFPCDGGRIWIKRGSPFAQRVGVLEDRMIRRILINVSVEYLTEI